jgi:ferrochelatase
VTRAVLLMAYGSPEQADDVEPYFTHIRGGRSPSPEAVRHLADRYLAVGGRTPLLQLSDRVRGALSVELQAPVYLGMKHWHPFIGDVIPKIAADGVTEIVAVALAPHYSRMSIGGYEKALEEAVARAERPIRIRMVEHWHLNRGFLRLITDRVRDGLQRWPAAQRPQVVCLFSAHSLPVRIREWDDPYERQLLETCRAVAERAELDNWRFAWQSAGDTGEPWLGPDIVDVIRDLYHDGVRHVLSIPVGFVSDHLEVLYDIDREARGAAEALGMTLHRSRMPNDDPEFVHTLASIVRETP